MVVTPDPELSLQFQKQKTSKHLEI